MRNLILFDGNQWSSLLPFTYTRPIADIRVGIMTIAQKWSKYLQGHISYATQTHLHRKYPANITEDNWCINATLLPDSFISKLITQLEPSEALYYQDELLVARLDESQATQWFSGEEISGLSRISLEDSSINLNRIQYPEDIFKLNGNEIRKDFDFLTRGRNSQKIPITNQVINPENVFVEPGAKVKCAILNASAGPIYIGKNAEIMEGSMIRGPFALCENGVVKMGAKIYADTTIGPYSKVGGEISNSVLIGYANKGHDGYLGNSVIGEWCNLGADTNTSNLKNNYAEVKIWDYATGRFRKTGTQFCGLMMGDHSKCGINTMFNTGTVVGVSANIFGSGYPRNFIPSFAWGGPQGYKTYQMSKVHEVASIVMSRRNEDFSKEDELILQHVFEQSSQYRSWEKAKT